MDELRGLFRQSSHYLAGRVGVILLGFVSFPLFTRLFSVADYGLMSLVLKVIATVTVLSKLGMQNSVMRFYQEHSSSSKRDALMRYFSTMFFGTAGTALSVTLLFFAGMALIPGSVVSPPIKNLLLFAAALILFRGLNSVLRGFLRVEEKTRMFNILDVAQKASTILAVCAFFFGWRRDVWALFAGTMLVEGGLTLGLSWSLMRRHLLNCKLFDADLFRGAALFGMPLTVYEFASMILDFGDRILVQHYLGSVQLGLYSAVYNISLYSQQALMVPLNLALFPLYMKLWVNKGMQQTQLFLSKSLDLFLVMVVGAIAVTTLTAHDAVTVLASAKYQAASGLLPILVAGVLCYAVHTFLHAGLLIHKKTVTMAKLVISAALLNLAMNVVLIPRMGLLAAAIATLVSYLFLVVMIARASFKVLPLRIEYAALGRYLLAGTLTVASLWRLNLGLALANLVVKGLSSVAIYAAVLWLADSHLRALVKDLLQTQTRTFQPTGTLATGDITPAVKE